MLPLITDQEMKRCLFVFLTKLIKNLITLIFSLVNLQITKKVCHRVPSVCKKYRHYNEFFTDREEQILTRGSQFYVLTSTDIFFSFWIDLFEISQILLLKDS